jgi:hypothetical protein
MTRMRKILLAGMAATALAGGGTTAVASHTSEQTNRYQFLIGTGGTSPPMGPDISRDPTTGNVLTVVGHGTFTKGVPSSAEGGGTFVVTDAAAHLLAQGTWTTTSLDSFVSYGNPPGFPEDFGGGLARLDIRIHPAGTSRTFAGRLLIYCALNKPGSPEGVTVFASAVRASFSQIVFGETLLVNQDSDPAPG